MPGGWVAGWLGSWLACRWLVGGLAGWLVIPLCSLPFCFFLSSRFSLFSLLSSRFPSLFSLFSLFPFLSSVFSLFVSPSLSFLCSLLCSRLCLLSLSLSSKPRYLSQGIQIAWCSRIAGCRQSGCVILGTLAKVLSHQRITTHPPASQPTTDL